MKKILFHFVLSCSMLQAFAQWNDQGSGITEMPRGIFSISAVDEQVVWAIAVNSQNVFTPCNDFTRSTDGGVTWTSGKITDSLEDYFPENIFALDITTAWVAIVSLPVTDRGRIYKTTDGGVSWQEQFGGFNDTGHVASTLHFFNANEGLAFGSPGTANPLIDSLQIFRTADGGTTWNRIPPSELPAPYPEEGVWIYSGNNSYDAIGNNLWFVTRANRVFRTTDKGITWQAYETGINNQQGLSSITFQDSLTGIVVATDPQKAARTSDGGMTWTSISIPGSPKAEAIEFIPGSDSTYIITDGFIYNSSSIAITHNSGNTWTTQQYAPSMVCIQFLSPTMGWGGTTILSPDSGGMYKWVGDLSDTTTAIIESDNYFSVGIYPNPVLNSSLTLSYDLKNQQPISVELLTLEGKTLVSLIQDRMRNAGSHQEVIMLPSTLVQGMYLLRIKTLNNSAAVLFTIQR